MFCLSMVVVRTTSLNLSLSSHTANTNSFSSSATCFAALRYLISVSKMACSSSSIWSLDIDRFIALAFKIFPLSSSDKLAKCAFVISGSSSIKPFLISRSRMAKSSNFTFVTQSPFAAAPSITYRNISRWSKPATCCCRSHKISHSARIGIILSL